MSQDSLVKFSSASNRTCKRLDSWKQIAAYVERHVTTVRRWEKEEGLPVHRHAHSKLDSVFAYSSELDAWLESRHPHPPCSTGLAEISELRAASAPLPPPPALTGLRSCHVALLGREREMELLGNAWITASRGQQVVLISGDAGQGKTRLALEFARLVTECATVLLAGCDREALAPFAPFVTMLQYLVRIGAHQTLRRCLKEVQGSGELVQLVPEIARLAPHVPELLPATAEGRRFRMFEAFAQLLSAMSRQWPMFLLFEDIHWADTGTLLCLRHLIRSTREAAVCIVITHREDEAACSELSEDILQSIRREFPVTRIHLGGLGEDDVRRFIESWTHRVAPQSLTEWMLKTTQGNALFLTELLAHFGGGRGFGRAERNREPVALSDIGLPKGIRQLIGRRLAGLSPASRRLLTLGAVIGREFDLPLVEALAKLPEGELLDRMEEAVTAGVLAETPGVPDRFSFTHALIRETLYSDIVGARRVRIHWAIGEALEQLSPHNKPPSGQLAHHFTEAAAYRAPEKAIDYAVRAGDEASARLALEDAARYYGMALRVLDLLPSGPAVDQKRFDLHTKRGRSFFQAGQWALAKAELELALRFSDFAEGVKRCELLVNVAEASFWLMNIHDLRSAAREAERLADQIRRDDLWADARAWMASAEIAEGDVSGGIESDRQTLARAGGIRSFGLSRIPLTLYWAGRSSEAVKHGAQAVEQARKSGDPAFLLYALQHFGLNLSGAGRYDEALRAFDEAMTLGRQCGSFPLLARAISMSVAPLLSLGDFDGAVRRATEARELAHRVAFEPPLVSAAIDLLLIHARSQDAARAGPLLAEVERAVQQASGWHAWKWKMRLSQARAELAAAKGNWIDAITFASDVIEQSETRSRPKYQALGLATRAHARGQLGQRQAVKDAWAAVKVARRLADPAVLLECLSVLIEQDANSDVLGEWQRTVDSILGALTCEPLRGKFLAKFGSLVVR
jgi:tetratricopeptide (TPR) repeat protein